MQKYIYIKSQFEGLHCYPDAPEEVAFLKQMHRHNFGVKVTIEVFHNERELEFFMVKKRLDYFIAKNLKKESCYSCETMSEKILNFLIDTYGENRDYKIEVNEDNQNGSIIKRRK